MAKDVNKETAHTSEDDGYTLRKRIAMGKPLPGGSFGVGPTDHVDSQDASKSTGRSRK